MALSPAAVETVPETPAPGAPADTQEAARRDGAETPEGSPSTTLALLQAEMDSVVKSMSDLVKVKDEDQITPYVKDPESGGEVDVAKEQLGVLVKIQHDLKRQQVVQQATLTSQFLLGKMQETMSKLLTERSKDFERQRKEMMLYMEKESNLHQNSMDQIENVVEKVGTTLDQFTSSLTTLSATIKDLSADQRTQGRDHLDILGRIHYEIQGTKELTGHVRSNTLSTSKEIKALIWQVGELRSGSTDSSGTVSSNKGSLLYLISEDLKTSTQSVLDAMATSVKALKETVEAGVNPEKSLKRVFQEYQEQQRAEDQRKEEARLQKEQEDQERQQLVTMIHPYTGQQMQLTGEQREQFIRDLATMKPTDFMSNVPVGTGSMGAGPTHIPMWGFPPGPPTTMGFGTMGTPATPSTPNPQGHVPSFVAPATLPVISKPTSSRRWNERQYLRRYHTFDVLRWCGDCISLSQSQISTACSFGSSLVWK